MTDHMRLTFRVLLTTTFCFVSHAAEYFVSPAGHVGNNGSPNEPWSLQHALSGVAGVQPGDVVWLLEGTYKGRFLSALRGTSENPIILRNASGANVRIDGSYSTSVAAEMPKGAAYKRGQLEVADASLLATGNIIAVGREEMQVDSTAGRTVLVNRGWNGTCGQSECPAHQASEEVRLLSPVLTVNGAYTWFWGVEITYGAHKTRYSPERGSEPRGGGIDWYSAVLDQCAGCRYINLVIHDVGGNGITSFEAGRDTEVYGNIIFNNGWDAPDRGHAHGLYMQNRTGTKRALDNVIFRQFGYGIQIYGSDDAWLENLYFEGNVFFNNGEPTRDSFSRNILLGGGRVANSITFKNNYSYYPLKSPQGENVIGYGAGCKGLFAAGNYFANGDAALTLNCKDVTLEENIFTGRTRGFDPAAFTSNRYVVKPTGTHVFVRPNTYEPGRAHVIAYNWDHLDEILVSLPELHLKPGDHVEFRNAQNLSEAKTFTYGKEGVSVLMKEWSAVQPEGNAAGRQVHATVPEFAVFLVKQVANEGPLIGRVKVSPPGATGVLVTWTTSKPTISRLEYFEKSSGVRKVTSWTVEPKVQQTTVLRGLNPNTRYIFQILCKDARGKTVTSSEFAFETAQP